MYRYNSSNSGLTGSGISRTGIILRRSGVVAGMLRRMFDSLAAWQDRRRQRFALARLDDRMLQDIGLTYADVEAELTKPFWR